MRDRTSWRSQPRVRDPTDVDATRPRPTTARSDHDWRPPRASPPGDHRRRPRFATTGGGHAVRTRSVTVPPRGGRAPCRVCRSCPPPAATVRVHRRRPPYASARVVHQPRPPPAAADRVHATRPPAEPFHAAGFSSPPAHLLAPYASSHYQRSSISHWKLGVPATPNLRRYTPTDTARDLISQRHPTCAGLTHAADAHCLCVAWPWHAMQAWQA